MMVHTKRETFFVTVGYRGLPWVTVGCRNGQSKVQSPQPTFPAPRSGETANGRKLALIAAGRTLNLEPRTPNLERGGP